jgi:hypothetical protein
MISIPENYSQYNINQNEEYQSIEDLYWKELDNLMNKTYICDETNEDDSTIGIISELDSKKVSFSNEKKISDLFVNSWKNNIKILKNDISIKLSLNKNKSLFISPENINLQKTFYSFNQREISYLEL